ncbi:hypothetical protein LY76DRAFT_668522, partial [Colletotrichum caudatum]
CLFFHSCLHLIGVGNLRLRSYQQRGWITWTFLFFYFSGVRASAEKGYYRTLDRHGSLAFIVFFSIRQAQPQEVDGDRDHGCGLDIIAGVLNKYPLRYCWRRCVFFALL